MPLPPRELIRPDEAAEYFRVTTRTIYLWLKAGLLASRKVGGVLRIPRAAIVDLERRSWRGPEGPEAEARTS